MRHPQWFGLIVDQMNRRKWINSSVAKYVHYYIDEQNVRDDLYRIWTTMRKFRPNLQHIKRSLTEHKIPLHLVFGSYDRVIPVKNGYRFQKEAAEWIHVHELQSGHLLLKEKHAAFIISLLIHE
jgi:pimeloyl-ACP methyl ester carboxylesterase